MSADTVIVPLDLIFLPNEGEVGEGQQIDKWLNDEIPIVASQADYARPSLFKKLTSSFVDGPLLDYGTRDRLIVASGVDALKDAKQRGLTWIKAKMTDEARQRWLARDPQPLHKLLRDTGRKQFYNPVYLEAFKKAKTSRPDSVRLDRIRRLLGPLGSGLRGLDIGCNMGYMSHHMTRQGFSMTGIDLDSDHLGVAKCLSGIYDLHPELHKTTFVDYSPEDNFDILFALTVLYHIFFRQDDMPPEDAAGKVGALTRSALFWESGQQRERDKEYLLEHGGFERFLSLGPTQGTGLKRELGVFLKPDDPLAEWLLERYQALGPEWIIG